MSEVTSPETSDGERKTVTALFVDVKYAFLFLAHTAQQKFFAIIASLQQQVFRIRQQTIDTRVTHSSTT